MGPQTQHHRNNYGCDGQNGSSQPEAYTYRIITTSNACMSMLVMHTCASSPWRLTSHTHNTCCTLDDFNNFRKVDTIAPTMGGHTGRGIRLTSASKLYRELCSQNACNDMHKPHAVPQMVGSLLYRKRARHTRASKMAQGKSTSAPTCTLKTT